VDQLSEILIHAQQGNDTEVCNLISKFKPLIKKYARQLSYDCAETDLIIATLEFIQCINPDRIKSCNEAVLVSYIATMLYNKKIDLYRNIILKKLEETNEEYELVDYSYCNIEEKIDWINCINQLSDKQRSILIRRYVMGYSDAEIARQFKKSRQSICKMKNKALKNLKLLKISEVNWNGK